MRIRPCRARANLWGPMMSCCYCNFDTWCLSRRLYDPTTLTSFRATYYDDDNLIRFDKTHKSPVCTSIISKSLRSFVLWTLLQQFMSIETLTSTAEMLLVFFERKSDNFLLSSVCFTTSPRETVWLNCCVDRRCATLSCAPGSESSFLSPAHPHGPRSLSVYENTRRTTTR